MRMRERRHKRQWERSVSGWQSSCLRKFEAELGCLYRRRCLSHRRKYISHQHLLFVIPLPGVRSALTWATSQRDVRSGQRCVVAPTERTFCLSSTVDGSCKNRHALIQAGRQACTHARTLLRMRVALRPRKGWHRCYIGRCIVTV